MKTTYNDILNSMKNTFYQQRGEAVEEYGDLLLRFEAVASEIYSQCCRSDFALRQAFVQTATGEYLDYHAQLRDMQRKPASCAKGSLKFTKAEGVTKIIRIPAGTVCSVEGYPFLQYKTDKVIIMRASNDVMSVTATALNPGEGYNIDLDRVNVIVDSIEGIESVTNDLPFTYGCDEENDEALRKRLIESYKVLSTGVSIQYYKDLVMNVKDVLDCNICLDEDKNFNIYVRPRETLDGAMRGTILDTVLIADFLEGSINLVEAEKKSIAICIEAKTSKADVTDSIIDKVKQISSAMKIGEMLDFNRIAFELAKLDGVDYCSFNCDDSTNGKVACGEDEYIRIEDIEVVEI